MKHFFSDKSGAVIVLFAVLLPLLMISSGLAIDVGYAYTQRSDLQNIADTAALAGGHQLPDNAKATSLAQKYVDENNESGAISSKIKFPASDKISVTVSKTIDLFFFKNFIDTDKLTLSATATAQAAASSTSGSIFDYALIHGDTKTSPNLEKSMDNFFYGNVGINSPIVLGNWQDRDNYREKLINAHLYINQKVYPEATLKNTMPKFRNTDYFCDAFGKEMGKGYDNLPEPIDISLAFNNNFIEGLTSGSNIFVVKDVDKDYISDDGLTLWQRGGNGMNVNNIINDKKHKYTGIYIQNKNGLQVSTSFENVHANFSIIADNSIALTNMNNLPINPDTKRPYQTFVCSKQGNIDLYFNNQGSFFAYAPNGILTIRNDYTNYGSLVAKTINFEGGKHTFYMETDDPKMTLDPDFGTPSLINSGSTSSVKLIE